MSEALETKLTDIVPTIKATLAHEDKLRRSAYVHFNSFDQDKDGMLSFEELRTLMKHMNQELSIPDFDVSDIQVERQIRRFDKDGNGQLDYFEFEKLYRNLLLVSLHAHEPIPFCREMFIGRRMGRPTDHYECVKVLGRGAFGTVSQLLCKEAGEHRCLKTIDKDRAASSGMPVSLVSEEIDKLKALDHPAILRLFEYYVDATSIYLVTDMFPAGHLLKVLEDKIRSRSPPTEAWVCDLFHQVCMGITYAHEKGLMHKDLKLDNLMLSRVDPPLPVVIDLGLAEIFPIAEADSFRSNRVSGTISTMAPEVIMKRFNYKCDVWSLGCCLYGLLCRKPTALRLPDGTLMVHPYPFEPPESNSPEAVASYLDLQRQGPNWDQFKGGAGARQLLERMLEFDENKRPAMKTVVQCEWLKGGGGPEVLCTEQLSALSDFHLGNACEHAILVDVASQLPLGKLHELSVTFEALDTDGNGRLDMDELSSAMEKSGLDKPSARKAAARFARGGSVEFSTFVAALIQSKSVLFMSHLKDAFNRLDTDGSGYITPDELQQLLTHHMEHLEAVDATHRVFTAFGSRFISFDTLREYFLEFFGLRT